MKCSTNYLMTICRDLAMHSLPKHTNIMQIIYLFGVLFQIPVIDHKKYART